MPFYEYQCRSCQYHVEVMQKITDPPLKKCPSCGRLTLRKLVSAPVFRLKGSGWYETDFKSAEERKRNLAGTEAEAKKPEAPASAATPAAAPASPAPAAAAPAAKPATTARPSGTSARAAAMRPKPKARSTKPAAKGRSRR